jgi:hypothetical protein
MKDGGKKMGSPEFPISWSAKRKKSEPQKKKKKKTRFKVRTAYVIRGGEG